MIERSPTIRVFVASPGDVLPERDRVELVINELNRGIAKRLGIKLECIRWENYVTPLMGRPEEVVLKQVELSNWDVFIGILWLRFGTPTGEIEKDSGKPFLSGTEEEFSWAYKIWRESGKPQILFYRCIRSPKDMRELQPDQYILVDEFFNKFRWDKEHPGIFRTYQDVEDFERRIREDLNYIIFNLVPQETNEYLSDLNLQHKAQGFVRLFMPSANEERNIIKSKSLMSSQVIKLIAHSGRSFLALVGPNFRKIITRRLEKGISFQLILANPWSETGLFIALAEMEQNANRFLNILSKDGNISEIDPIKIIQESSWYSIKFRNSMTGYKKLKGLYGDQILARLTSYELPASFLITDTECFVEPYISINLQERFDREMLTFEIQLNRESHLYRHADDFFNLMWIISDDYEEFIKEEENYKKRFIERMKNRK